MSLRKNLGRLDPMHSGVEIEPVTSPSSRHRLERIMSVDTGLTANPTQSGPKRLRLQVAAGLAVLIAVVAVGANLGSSAPPLELALTPDDAIASCLQFDVAILAGMPVAFEGTVTGIEGETVTLSVDRWFKGGEASEVNLISSAGSVALIGGVNFEMGGQYLITATDGTVNACGFSAASTPEMRAAFEQAFGA